MQSVPAPVCPRFISDATGASLRVEDSVLEASQRFRRGVIEIAGPPGAGKTSTLKHLAAVLPRECPLTFLMREDADHLKLSEGVSVVEVDSNSAPLPERIVRFNLAPWSVDEYIEYAMNRHAQASHSVLARLLGAPDRDLLEGLPEICTLVLDEMAARAEVSTVADAIARRLRHLVNGDLSRLPHPQTLLRPCSVTRDMKSRALDEAVERLLLYGSARLVACAMQIMDAIENSRRCLEDRVSVRRAIEQRFLLEILDSWLTERTQAMLHARLQKDPCCEMHPLLASVVFLNDPGWRPASGREINLSDARLHGADWPNTNLRGSRMENTDLSGANMEGATLSDTRASGLILDNAQLRGARMRRMDAAGACLRNADLTGAYLGHSVLRDCNLSHVVAVGARFNAANLFRAILSNGLFRRCVLVRANLLSATLTNADFSECDFSEATLIDADLRLTVLTRAIFSGASMSGCNLEDTEIVGGVFSAARLKNAHLTGSSMPGACFRDASLRGAYMAHIDWPGADLRGAILNGATFHMGSSRSGLVDSFLASEGTRTGFYTSDYDDHLYRRPEDIRSANLCGCDLRGADVTDVDFYRVDLRGARFDESIRRQLIVTGAILD